MILIYGGIRGLLIQPYLCQHFFSPSSWCLSVDGGCDTFQIFSENIILRGTEMDPNPILWWVSCTCTHLYLFVCCMLYYMFRAFVWFRVRCQYVIHFSSSICMISTLVHLLKCNKKSSITTSKKLVLTYGGII